MNQSKEAMKKADVEEFGTNLQNKNWIGSDFFFTVSSTQRPKGHQINSEGAKPKDSCNPAILS